MRALAEAMTVIVGCLAIARVVITHVMRRRRLSNPEHVQKLLKENEEMDKALDKMKGDERR